MSNFAYLSVLLSTFGNFFLAILCISGYFCGPPVKKNCGPLNFYVVLSTFGYFRALMSNFEYFPVLLSTFGYFFVILSIVGYFCGPPCENKQWSSLLLCTCEYFLVLLGTYE